MDLNGKTVGFALTGSFCTINSAVDEMKKLAEAGADVVPIMSEIVYSTDTRFGSAYELRRHVKEICGREIISTVKEAEPIGPKKLLDLLIAAPCTGCTIGKLANGIADTSVTMACKAHLRNARPVLIALSTNDGLSVGARNIGELLCRRNVYFVPFGQDDSTGKPTSLVADMRQILPAAQAALAGRQLQPILC